MPTPVFVCGLECGSLDAIHFSKQGTADFNTSIVDTGLRSCRTNPTAAQGTFESSFVSFSSTVGVARQRLYIASAPIASGVVLGFGVASITYMAGLAYNILDSKWYAAFDNGTTVTMGATGVTIATGSWVTIDVRVNVVANPWLVDVSVGTTSLGQASVAVAASTTDRYAFGTRVRAVNTFDLYHDNLTVSLTSADYPLSVGKLTAFSPTRDGTHTSTGTNFVIGQAGGSLTVTSTAVYTLLDDVPLAVNTSDFVNQQTSAPLTYVEVGFATASGAPMGVELIVGAHSLTTAQGNMKFKWNDGGTTVAFWNRASSGSSALAINRAHYASKPTGGAWTLAAFDALLLRGGYSTDANPDQFWDCAMMEVAFPASAAGISVLASGLGSLTVPVNSTGWYHQSYISGLV